MSSPSVFLTAVLAALARGGDEVLFRGDEPVTYREAHEELLRLHGGLGPVEVVAVDLANRPATVLVQLAAMLRGARVVLMPASAPRADQLAAASAAGVTTVITDQPGAWPVEDVRTLAGLAATPAPVRMPGAVDVIFPSGGTTGTPKLIRHSGIYDGMAHIFTAALGKPERTLVVAPLTHMTGHVSALGALLRGDSLVVQDGFDAGAVLAAIERHRVTTLSLTPPRLAAVLDHPARPGTRLDSVRSLSLGAAPLAPHRFAQALEVFGATVGQGYGLTEAPMIASIAPGELIDHPERLGSVGRIVPGMEARITDGEVEVRGLSMMDGYLGAPPIGAGWLRTGDLGHFDDEGYLYLTGRADDVVLVGEHGTKVAPETVEHALAAHPSVRAAAVFGVPGADGQSLHAVVVPEQPPENPGENPLSATEIRAHAREVLGREHFVPSTVEFVDALPLTGVGKVDKRALRAAFGE